MNNNNLNYNQDNNNQNNNLDYNNQNNNQYYNNQYYNNQNNNHNHIDYNMSSLHFTINQYINYNSNVLNLLIDNNNIMHRFTRHIDYYYRNHLTNNMQNHNNPNYYNPNYYNPNYYNQWYNYYNQNTINNHSDNDDENNYYNYYNNLDNDNGNNDNGNNDNGNNNNDNNDYDDIHNNDNDENTEITSMTIPINLERGLNNENREYFRNLSQENISTIIENNIEKTTFNLVDNPNDTICAICQDDFESDTEVGVMKHCNHIFKYDSLITWIHQKHTCPKCRYNILTNTNMICYNDSMVHSDYRSLNHNSSFILTYRQFRELLVVMFANNNITLVQ